MSNITFNGTISIDSSSVPMNTTAENYIMHALQSRSSSISVTLNKSTEEQDWLKKLQVKLNNDRQKETTQRSPVYYGILDYEWRACREGDGETYAVCDADNCEDMLIEEFAEIHKKDIIRYQNRENRLIIDENTADIIDTEELINYINNTMPCSYTYDVQLVPFIAKDKLFLTREDTEAYLASHKHNHHPKAHSYAMTAQDSPTYEKLLDILMHIDFEKSNIVLEDKEHSPAIIEQTYEIRRNADGHMLYFDAKELIDLCLDNEVVYGKKGEYVQIFHEASKTEPDKYPAGMYNDDYEETIQSVMRDDTAIKTLLSALSFKHIVFKPSLDTDLLSSSLLNNAD